MRIRSSAQRVIVPPPLGVARIARETVDCCIYQPVQRCRALHAELIAGVPVFADQPYFLVKSVFTDRCYVLVRNLKSGEWMCSSTCEKVKEMCIYRTHIYRQELRTRKARKAARATSQCA